ncbi:MAG: hypothetical protein ABIC82_01140 [bacterium]
MEDYKIGALIEDFRSKLDIVCEGIKMNRDFTEVVAIEQKKQSEIIDTIKIEIVGLKKGQANLEDGQAVIKDKIINLESGQETIKDKIINLGKGQANLEKGQEVIKDDLTEVKSMLRRKVDVEEVERIEKRVIRLERLAGAV